MPLRHMMTQTASTTRHPATTAGGKRSTPVANLTNLKITPIMLSGATGQHAIRMAIGLDGAAIQVYETYTEAHAHTDSSVSVNQMPDIKVDDRLIVAGITYGIRWCEIQPATTSFGATMLIYITEEKSA